MYAIEFQTIVKNGVIEIPPEYRQEFQHNVRVLLLGEDSAQTTIQKNDQSVGELRPFGLCAGDFVVPDDFDEPLPDDLLKAFEGE